ncbi:hydroxymethylglutaryl-CoA lyase [Aminobacter carboxidus]|uniref:Hydroxymethylglutaryl-CoA lyase n=1 Tax=Aminobacter carboxidus TaxID=376165 RepID=A0ABR9GYD2_9HYPH|nr:hydroxymethylglutaryl-CoA lyase [Aminobacter carboxidus]MBE1208549.1 hydroxymethylglutaryl-CoA lyase [Aminobacter carboxidus]
MTGSGIHGASGGALPNSVRIVEVGPRDGLQNEQGVVPLAAKLSLIDGLVAAGLRTVEAGSFVSPRWVPQMADTDRIVAHFRPSDAVEMPVLVPNLRGLELAKAAGARTVAVFAAATESFSRANLNASRSDSLARLSEVAAAAQGDGMRVRGYVSCAVHCPYEGWVEPGGAAELAASLTDMGCYEVSMCDTTGAASPGRALAMAKAAIAAVPIDRIAVHFHDTFGQALVNTLACLELGISVVDSSVSGLGGCPYSPGAAGNLATEDLVYMLDGLGIATCIDLDALVKAGAQISDVLGRKPASRTALALTSRRSARRIVKDHLSN